MTQENAAKGAAEMAAKELVKQTRERNPVDAAKGYPERHSVHKELMEMIAMKQSVANEINTLIAASERRLVLFLFSMELTNFWSFKDARSNEDGAGDCERNNSLVHAHQFFLLERMSLTLGPKANNERFFVRFNSMLIRGETEAKWETISIVYNGNLVALQQSADRLRHSIDCSIVFCFDWSDFDLVQ